MKKKLLAICCFTALIFPEPFSHLAQALQEIAKGNLSQSEGFFQIYPWEAVKKALELQSIKDPLRFRRHNFNTFDALKDAAIAHEKEHKKHYAFYHGTSVENFLLILFHTYLSQIKYNWVRKDFYLLRNPADFFNKDLSMKEFLEKYYFEDYINKIGQPDYEEGFDHVDEFKKWLLSTSTSFVSGTYTNSESSLYFFTQNRGGSSTPYYLYQSRILKKYSSVRIKRFNDEELDGAIYKVGDFIIKKIEKLNSFIERIGDKSGMLLQILIPENIVDDCAYPCTSYGIPITQQLKGITDGWDTTYGFYFKITPFLKTLQTNPSLLNDAIISDKSYKHDVFEGLDKRKLPLEEHNFYALETVQSRILLRKKYFDIELDEKNRLKNGIKMHILHTIPQKLFETITDMIYTLSRIILEEANIYEKYRDKDFKEKYLSWYASTTDIEK